MADIVRGFRRIGWVISVPVAALLFLAFFEGTKEFSASDYEATALQEGPWVKYGGRDLEQPGPGQNRIEMPGLGYADFDKEVPQDVAANVIADFRNTREKADHEKLESILA